MTVSTNSRNLDRSRVYECGCLGLVENVLRRDRFHQLENLGRFYVPGTRLLEIDECTSFAVTLSTNLKNLDGFRVYECGCLGLVDKRPMPCAIPPTRKSGPFLCLGTRLLRLMNARPLP